MVIKKRTPKRKQSGGARATAGRKRPARTSAPTAAGKSLHAEDLAFKDLTRLPELQMRTRLDESHVLDLVDAINAGVKLPPCKVYKLPDRRKVVTDGFHRCEAYARVGIETIPCEVISGSFFEALCSATEANKEHLALKRLPQDKRRAMECFLAGLHEAGENWTCRRIADHVGVSHTFVNTVTKYVEAERRFLSGATETVSSARNGATETVSSARVAADGRVFAPKKPETPKCTLPSAIRDLVPGKHFGSAQIGKKLAASGVATAGDFQVRLKSGDLMGLDKGEADMARAELHWEGIRRVVVAAKAHPESLLMALVRPMAAKFHLSTLQRVVLWRRQEARRNEMPQPAWCSDPLDELTPTSDDDARSIMAALVGCAQLDNATKDGPAFFEAMGLATGATETVSSARGGATETVSSARGATETVSSAPPDKPTLDDMVSEALIDLGKGAKAKTIQEYILAKHKDHYAEESIANCIRALKERTPPTLSGGTAKEGKPSEGVVTYTRRVMLDKLTACLRRKGSDGFVTAKEDAPLEARFTMKLVMVKGFPTTVAGMLSQKGISTARELLEASKNDDVFAGARKTLVAHGCTEPQVKTCIDAVEGLFRIPSK